MSNAGCGGPGDGAGQHGQGPGGPQDGSGHPSGPPNSPGQGGAGQPQNTPPWAQPPHQSAPGPQQPAASPSGGAPQGPWQSPQWQQPPSQPSQGPGYGQGPGVQPPAPHQKRPWGLIAVAASCIAAMILVVGGGIGFLVLRRGDPEPVAGDPTTTSDSVEPSDSEASSSDEESASAEETPTTEASDYSEFKVLGLGEFPEATPEELLGVMQDNPLTEGGLPDVGECELPATPTSPSQEQLQAVLDAASGCLNQVWSVASSDRGLPWTAPDVVVYTWPDVPSSSSCEADTFAEDFPRMCNLDSTIYWPVGYGTATDFEDEAHVPGAYLWDLAYMYSNAASWNSTLVFYQGELRNQYEDTDPEAFDDAWRRNSLQWLCWASAASMQVPSAAQPSQELRDALGSPDAWEAGEPPNDITPETRARWISAGFDSGGDLATCNTWTAETETVS